ncbi:hypothetical protein M8818_005482 [Zalaria obscura]|uniref:Uncharacterized protein n=1 Tax=Zalaria obscura TaxID=2024903 RepID=A0ACC3S8R4_9PEZI
MLRNYNRVSGFPIPIRLAASHLLFDINPPQTSTTQPTTMSTPPPSLPTEMNTQFLPGFNKPYTLTKTALPTISSPYDILIRVDAASYCHTDAVLAAGDMPPNPPSFPHIGCHEYAGTIVQLPSSAPTSEIPKSKFKIGDKVGVPGRSFHPCGTCYECLDTSTPDADEAGYSVYCPNSMNNGISGPGGFREYAVVDARQVALIPSPLSCVETAPLMCAGITIFAAIKKCGLGRGQRVAIMGAGGGLGHIGLQFATKMGLRTLGVDAADGPLEVARGLGTGARIVDARVEDPEEITRQVGAEDGKTERGDMGFDAVIILPESQRAFDFGVKLLRNHGKVVVVSFPSAGFHISAGDVVFRDIQIVGSLVGSNKTLVEMLDFAAKHDVRAIVRRFSLARLNELVEEYHKGGGGKLVVDVDMAMEDQ